MQYEHRLDTKTSNKLERLGWFDYAHSLTEMASICHEKKPPDLPCVRGRGIRWRFGRQIRHCAGTSPGRENGKVVFHMVVLGPRRL